MATNTDLSSAAPDGTDSSNRSESLASEASPHVSSPSGALDRDSRAAAPSHRNAPPATASHQESGTSTATRHAATAAGTHSRPDDRTTSTTAGPTSADSPSLVGALASGSPFIAFVAAVETLIATALLGLRPTVAPLVVALVTFAVYTVDHVADADTDAASTPQRALLSRRYGDQLMIAATVAYGVAVALSIAGGPLALAVTLLPGACWVAYASDWLPDVGRWIGARVPTVVARERVDSGVASGATDGGRARLPRLKDVLVVNSLLVASGWAITLTVLPMAFADQVARPTVAVVFAYFFLRSFVDAELPNVRDVKADAAVGVATLPVVLGVGRTRTVLYGVDLLVAGLVAAAATTGLLPWSLAGALGAGLAASMCITALAGRVDDAAVLGVAPDCTYLLVGVAIAGVQLIG